MFNRLLACCRPFNGLLACWTAVTSLIHSTHAGLATTSKPIIGAMLQIDVVGRTGTKICQQLATFATTEAAVPQFGISASL